ncbi:MAG: D-alanyl-D-alanine carboxypeptidase [Bacteroidales bacterium]|nr:D-alanyl-D-alanine carboxypeptidase [Clostridium sp.]MCM1203026.1 D-alanyl-D-alanine carboxypeptidase [Bacteroidales bacterium]
MKKKFAVGIVIMIMLCLLPASKASGETNAVTLDIESPSVLLMELNSGQVLYEKDADKARRPASVTKIMTMLLAFEAIDSGQFNLDSLITVSEHAASMGGSQVYLETGETQTVEDILKCMIVSSANDAAVAMGEAIAGSETGFVEKMNAKAKELGMTNTHFENACGLEAKGHLMSARDIAVLSRELLLKYPQVTKYSTIWMDTIIHKTRKGESEFGLANTNKFLKKYEGATGLKTGYTSAAGFSMSATATRNGTTLIAVVMGSKTKDIRYSDAAKLLDYGFANCSIYEDYKVLDGENKLEIKNGVDSHVTVEAEGDFHYVFVGNAAEKDIAKKLVMVKDSAPIEKGEVVAKVEYSQDGKVLGSVNILAHKAVPEQKYYHALKKLFQQYLNIY